jgi:hypothetical protein
LVTATALVSDAPVSVEPADVRLELAISNLASGDAAFGKAQPFLGRPTDRRAALLTVFGN